MKRNGFTLAELLGVIVILAAIALIAFPPIINQIKKSHGDLDSALNSVILTAAEQYFEENNYSKDGQYCISLQVLINNGKLISPVSDSDGNIVDNYTFYINYDTTNNVQTYLAPGDAPLRETYGVSCPGGDRNIER